MCWCWCSLLVPPLLFCVPRLVFRLSNSHLIFIFISSSSPFHPHSHFTVRTSVAHPAGRGVCVEHLNRCKTSTVAFCDSSSFHLAGGQEPMIVCPGQRRPDNMGVKAYLHFFQFSVHGTRLSQEPHHPFFQLRVRLPQSELIMVSLYWFELQSISELSAGLCIGNFQTGLLFLYLHFPTLNFR